MRSLVSEGTFVPIRSFRLDEYFCSGRLTRRVDALVSLPTWLRSDEALEASLVSNRLSILAW